jgi:hypothetical protein
MQWFSANTILENKKGYPVLYGQYHYGSLV